MKQAALLLSPDESTPGREVSPRAKHLTAVYQPAQLVVDIKETSYHAPHSLPNCTGRRVSERTSFTVPSPKVTRSR